ncbi:MAG: NACHT domain-containing protein [Aulosira sp. ZfuVER01]|nr:NACHT domain-containing protein [Aulosira sp. ZfuVER01]MDZ7996448.1 NACHT domain-containing protein [Aulosira sp. DedVER01a]MDZ8050344.1 NACHT domain-containing protein [Aulosira sp. ZfuCHP01]
MTAIVVDREVWDKLKQAYAEKFGGSPKLLIAELNHVYQAKNQTSSIKDVISDKTIRNFFNNTEPMKVQEKNLNFLCGVLLGCESYQEALRQRTNLENLEQPSSDVNTEWIERYQEYIRAKCGTMKVLTMTQPVQLDSIYANVNVLESVKAKKQKTIEEILTHLSSENLSFSRLNYRVSTKSLAAVDALKHYKKLLIWGSPGAGKTTFLKHLAMYAANLEQQPIPIFISLKAFAEEEDKLSLIDLINREFVKFISEPSQIIQELLELGRFLILLDGLDEVAETESNRIYRNINTLVEQYSKNIFVLTCRSGASDYTFEHFTEVEIADFNENQVVLFVKKWFESSQEPQLAEKFLAELGRNISIKELTTSPLLLTMLCLVFEDNYDFPRNRYLLTEDAVNILLRKWDASRRIERNSVNKFNLPYQRKVNLLSQIAYEAFHQEPQKHFWHQRELERLIENYLENILEIAPETLAGDSQEILRTIEANHGLLIKQAQDFYSFSHLTFQEYFVAHHIVERRNTETLNEVIKQHLTNRQWREVFLMISGRLANTDEFLKLIFRQINTLVVENKALQDMLTWLDDVTTLHAVKSSSWRAFYLLVDQVFELYSNLQTKVDYNLAQELAVSLKEVNKERKRIYPRSLLSDFAFNLVDFHANLISTKTSEKGFESQKLSPLLKKELPASDDPVTMPQLRSKVSFDKDSHVISITKQEDKNISQHEDYPLVQTGAHSEHSHHHGNDYVENSNNTNEDLADFLVFLKESLPSEQAPESDWLDWANRLRSAMRLYLNIGWNDVKFTPEEIKALKDYLYANILLLKCIKGDSYSTKDLRNQIIDNMLLPSQRIPSELLTK